MFKKIVAFVAVCGLIVAGMGHAQADVPSLFASNTFTATGSLLVGPINGQGACQLNISGGANGDVTIETTNDNFATTGVPFSVTNIATGNTVTLPVSVASSQYLAFSTAGLGGPFSYVRARVSTYNSGSIVLTMTCGPGGGASGSSGGSGGNVTIVAPTDSAGNVKVTTPAPAATPVVSAPIAAIVGPGTPTTAPGGGNVGTIDSNGNQHVALPAVPTVVTTTMPSATPVAVATTSGTNVRFFNVTSSNTSFIYCMLYNTGTITLGTTVPIFTVAVPPSGSWAAPIPAGGTTFPTAVWAYCSTTFRGSTPISAGSAEINVGIGP